MNSAALERRIRRIEDREAIRELVGRYGLAMDNKDFDLVAKIFAPDARFGWVDGTFDIVGRDAIVAMYSTRLATAGPSFHFTHDQFIDWDPVDDNRATGLVLAHAETAAGACTRVGGDSLSRPVRPPGRTVVHSGATAQLPL